MDHGKMEALAKGYSTEDLASRFEKFFRTYYSREIHKLVQGYPAEKSLWVDFRDLDRYDISLADEVISNPDAAIAAAEKALRNIDLPVGLPSIRVNVRFHSLPAINKLIIKDLRSEHVGNFMAVEGIVRKATDVRPKLILGAYECQKCGGVTRISQDGNKVKEPFICEECEGRGPFKLLVSESTFLDSQKILIQESLEDLHGGEHPKQLSIHLEDDLTGKISPGDRVELVGILRAQRKTAKGKGSRVFEIFLEANSFKPVQLDFEEVTITPEDEKQIKELSKDPMIYEKIRDSIAPHIYGYADIKEAIMYQLFSSPTLELPDGGRIRGDSHIIIMGEPATGKCVTGDTVLYLADGGRKRIKELIDPIFEDNPACQTEDGRAYILLREPLFVPAMNDSLKLENRRVTHVWRRKYRGRIFKITTLSGKSIKTTPEHPFFAIRDGVITCIPAEELVPGERVATPEGPRVLHRVESKGATPWEATLAVSASINTPSEKLLDKPALRDGGMPLSENPTPLGQRDSPDVFWDEVAGIDVEQIDGYVYDLTVEGCHNFIANGIVVHNSEILQYVAKVLAPRGVYASGKGTSAAGLCVAPSSLVCLDNGVLSPIGDMVEKELGKGKKEYRRGIWIAERPSIYSSTFALNGRAELEPKEIVQYWKLKAPSKVIRIITKTGREIEVTPETPLFSASREGFEWKKAKHLKLGDFLASARDMKTGQEEAPLFIDLIESDPIVYGCEGLVKRAITLLKEKHGLNTRELSKRLGVKEDKLYHAWVNREAGGKPKLSQVLQLADSAGISKEEVIKAVESYSLYHGHKITLPVRLNKNFLYFAGLIAGDGDLYKTPFDGCFIRFSNSSPKIFESFRALTKDLFNIDALVKKDSDPSPSVACFHSKLVGEVLQRLGIPFSPKSHKIDLTPELLSLPDELLASYISGLFDCDGCVVSRADKGSPLEYVTTSEGLAKKLHLSLLRFAIVSKLRKRPRKGKKTGYYEYHICICGKNSLMAFKEKIGFRHEEKRKALEEVISRIREGDPNYDSVPFAGKVMKNVREAFGLSSREIFNRKNYGHEQGFFKSSTKIVKKFIARMEELKDGYKDRVYLEVSDSLKSKLYRRARKYLSRKELSILLGRSEAAVNDYFLRRSRKVRIPYSVLETLCNFLEAKDHADCSFKGIGKKVSPTLKEVEERVMKAEELLKELKTSANVLWDEIVDMEWRSPEYKYVYDLTIHDAHNFLVNGIVSHNTAAAIKDEFGDGGWSLEAGALVLADNGVACLMPESKVVVNDEIRRIEELFDRGYKTRAISHGEEVEICDLNVRTVSMSGLKTLPSMSPRIRRKRYEGKVLEIAFNSGFRIRLTPEHELLHGDTLEWREAREFKRGDFVVAPLKLPDRKDDIFLLDILPDEWKAILSREDKEELRSRVLKKSSLAEFNRRYGISKDFLSGNGSVKVGILRRILRDLGCYDEWREKPLGYGRKKSGEKLKVSKVTPDMAYFLGFLYGDGSVSVSWRRSTVSIIQSTKNESQIEAVRRAFTGFSNRKLRVYKRTTRSDIRGDKAERENLILYAGSNLVAHIYEYITRDSLRDILKLPDEALKAFIAGCLDSDGCLSIKRSRGYKVVHLEFQLSRDEEKDKAFILALRRFDCYAKLVKGKRINKIIVTGREDVASLLDAIGKYSVKTKNLPLSKPRVSSFSGKLPAKQVAEVCRAIASSVNKTVLLDKGVWSTIHAYMNGKYQPVREQLLKIDRRLSGLLSQEIREKIHILTSRDYHLDRIVRIKKLDYTGYVYDLYVPGYHNFLCDGILVHNCIDEFDKMEADDRGAMHEAMEQQSYHHDVEIRLADGRRFKIGDFVERLMREHSDKVIHTENGAKLFIEPLGLRICTSSFKENYPANIFSVSRHKAPDRFVRLFFDNGRSITVTPEHPVFVFKNGRIQTEEAGKILEGNHSVVPLGITYRFDGEVLPLPELKERKDVKLPREMSSSLARVLGLLVTDGGAEINRGRPCGVMFVNKDEGLIKIFNSDIKALFGLEPYVHRKGDVLYSRVISKDVYRFFRGLDERTVTTGKDKALPELVFGMRKEYKRELLRAVFEGDGHAKEDGLRVELSMEKRGVLEQVQELLLEFGIYSYIRDFNTFSKLFITGDEHIRRFFKEIGFIGKRKNLCLDEVLKRSGYHWTVKDILQGSGMPLRHILRKLRLSQKEVFGNTSGEESSASRSKVREIIGALKTRAEEIKDAISRIDTTEDFRDLKHLRTRLRVSQHEIADSLGVVHQTISNWELRKTSGSVEDYRKALRGIAKKMINPVEGKIHAIEEAVSPSIRLVKVIRKEIVENRDQKWVYDIQVEPTHNFISQGLILHNSVSIAKAGILATFRSRCSILAAANPKFGRFDDYRSISEQINLPPTILSVDHDEPVMVRENGKIRIEKIGELVDRYYFDEEEGYPIYLKDKIEALAFEPATFKINWTPIKYVFRHKITEPLYKVTLETGRRIKLTSGHCIYVYDNGKVMAKPTRELTLDDYVVIPNKLPGNDGDAAEEISLVRELIKLPENLTKTIYLHNVPPNAFERVQEEIPPERRHWIGRRILPLRFASLLTEEELRNCTLVDEGDGHAIPTVIPVDAGLMRFLGYYIAEGSLTISSSKSFIVSLSFNRTETRFIEDTKEIYRGLFNVEPNVRPDKNASKVVISDKIVYLFLDKILNVSEGARNKRVPEIVFNVPRELQKEFLIGYFRGDRGVTMSKYLISDILYLLLQNNIIGHMWKSKEHIARFHDGHETLNKSYVLTSPSPCKEKISKNKNRLHLVPYKHATGTPKKVLSTSYDGGYGKPCEDPWLGAHLQEDLFHRKHVSTILDLKLLKRPLTTDRAAKLFKTVSHREHARSYLQLVERGLVEKERISGREKEYSWRYQYSLSEKGEQLLEELPELDRLIAGDLAFVKVKSIEPTKPTSQYVYDLSTPGCENFVAGIGGVVCHNSRFDLIFFVRDSLEETQEVARHILSTVVSPERAVPKLDPKLLRKYIAYARQRVVPHLTEEARERIEKFYVEMREMARSAEDVPIPMTARQLWAIVRIARASSRVRLSDKTTLEDVERAIRLIRVSLKQAGLDLETGRVDIDKIMVGVTKSQRDRITRILEIIREIEREYGSAKKSEIIDRAAEMGIPEVEAEKAIEKLRKDGHIYDPRRDDRYKVV